MENQKGSLLIAFLAFVCVILVAAIFFVYLFFAPKKLYIGIAPELSGSLSDVGKSSLQGAQMAVGDINKKGGVLVGGRRYMLHLQVADNGSSVAQTQHAVETLLSEKVLAIIGPNASAYAIVAGDIAEKAKTLLISPWSTNPLTTLSTTGEPKQYVYRAAYVDSFQGQALALFVLQNLHAKKAAILYDKTLDVSKVQADFFTDTFMALGGKVVNNQSYTSVAKGISQQLLQIKASKPDVIFLPAYYGDAATVIQQARKMGITTQFLGSDMWGGKAILPLCRKDCEGSYISGHYNPSSPNKQTQQFVQSYQATYHTVPDDIAALTYDSVGLFATALSKTKTPTRESVALAMKNITLYNGATGTMHFAKGSRDPIKDVTISVIKNGVVSFVTIISPQNN